VTPVDRTAPPPPSLIRAFDFPDVEALDLGNGLALRTARLPRLPLVSTLLVLSASESSLEEERAGLAVLTANALEGGTGGRTAGELAEALESIGAGLQAAAGWDATTLALTCVAERLPEALALLAEVARDPSFPDTEVARARDQQLARIRQRAMDPSALANDWAARLFHEDRVPYGRPVAGTHDSVATLDHQAVRGFAEASYRPRGSALVLAGDVDVGDAAELAQTAFGSWTGSAPPRREVEARARSSRRTIHVVHRPGAVQSEIRVGHPGVNRVHPDYFPLIVANSVLGGAFTSRLNLNLRERHGFTYGVRSRFHFRRDAGPFVVSASVGSEVTAAAVRETLSELEAFAREGPTEGEVEAARDYIAGVFPLRVETTSQVAARVAELTIFGLPEDHHARYRDRVRGVTTAAAREAAVRHVRPEEATIVVVGDAEVVQASLAALDVGAVELHLSGDARVSALP
jgi:zinc protease